MGKNVTLVSKAVVFLSFQTLSVGKEQVIPRSFIYSVLFKNSFSHSFIGIMNTFTLVFLSTFLWEYVSTYTLVGFWMQDLYWGIFRLYFWGRRVLQNQAGTTVKVNTENIKRWFCPLSVSHRGEMERKWQKQGKRKKEEKRRWNKRWKKQSHKPRFGPELNWIYKSGSIWCEMMDPDVVEGCRGCLILRQNASSSTDTSKSRLWAGNLSVLLTEIKTFQTSPQPSSSSSPSLKPAGEG